MSEIWIYSHWLSHNLGDRYQGRAILRALNLYSKVIDLNHLSSLDPFTNKVILVNFFPDFGPMRETIDGYDLPVYSPEEVKNRRPTLIILATGSINYEVSFIPWIELALKKNTLKEVIVWGGFSHGKKDEEIYWEGLKFLVDPRVTFWSRSWRDVEIYRQYFRKESRLAGDPMAYWIFDIQQRKQKDRHGIVVIPSIHALEYSPREWKQLIHFADKVICIDDTADWDLQVLFPQIEIITNPEILILILIHYKRVISGRLHSSLLSALMGIETIMVVTDNALPGEGTYKFEAVARTGSGPDRPLCSAVGISEVLNFDPEPEELYHQEYIDLTRGSFSILDQKIN